MGIQREEPEKWESNGNFVLFLVGACWEFSRNSVGRARQGVI